MRKSGQTLFVQLGQDHSRFLCATVLREKNRPGSLNVLAFGEEESSRSLEEIAADLSARKLRPKNLVLLLPRSEFEVHFYQLPEVESDDLPSVISNLVSESMDTMEFTTDFVLHSREPDGQNALTWSLEDKTIQDFRDEARKNGMSLVGITSHVVGSISLWRNLVHSRSPHAVVVTIANRSIDFSVIYNHEVTHIRSIPFSQEAIEPVTSRLISELQRTVAITGDADESESTRVYLFGSPEHRKPIAEALTEEFEVPVSILNPIDNTEFKDERLTVAQSESYAHLIGAAKAYFFDKLDVDLISPRRAVQKTLPWRRIAIWVVLIFSAIGAGGFVIWDDATQQEQEIAERRKHFDSLAGDARRVLEMKDELAAIRAWRKNEVVWLDQLDELSKKLPPREQSLIRRISMSASDSGGTKIDLAVEVNDNSLVAGLEDLIRTKDNKVASKRVSESAVPDGEKWNFETSIQFNAVPPKLSFIPEKEVVEQNTGAQNTDTQNTNEQSSGEQNSVTPDGNSNQDSIPKSSSSEEGGK